MEAANAPAIVLPIQEREMPTQWLRNTSSRSAIAMEIKMMDITSMYRNIKNGKFEALFGDFYNGYGGISGYFALFGEDSWFGYRNPEVIQLLTDLQLAANPLAEGKVYEEFKRAHSFAK